MSRNQVVFFSIILAALLIVGVGIVLQGLGGSDDNGGGGNTNAPRNSTATPGSTLQIELAASPLLEPWLREAVAAYHATNPVAANRPVRVQLEIEESTPIWADSGSAWNSSNHPTAWIPDATYAIDYAAERSMAFEIVEESLVTSPLIWGVYESRSLPVSDLEGSFDTPAVQAAALAESWGDIPGGNTNWRFVTLAFPRPERSEAGYAALLTLTGGYANAAELPNNLLSDGELHRWLEPMLRAVSNFSSLGNDPANVMATRSGTADMGLLPEALWLRHFARLNQREAFLLHYPDYTIVLDFPLALWGDSNAEEQAAVEHFAAFLLNSAQQSAAAAHGLRPARGGNLANVALFAETNGQAQPEYDSTAIVPPNRGAAAALLGWFSRTRGATP